MTDKKEPLKATVEILRNELEQLFAFFERGLDYHKMVYELWNAKDILGHLTFWHESFARNISDVGKGIQPKPLKGKLSEVNRQSVETTKNESTENLIKRLKDAQNTIEAFVFEDTIHQIPYKKGSRDYTKTEHLEVVSNHIHKHLKDIQRTYGKTNKQNGIAGLKPKEF
jgi:hypothetical protein